MRFLDQLLGRSEVARQGYWEGMASGAAVFMSSYDAPNRESAVATLAAKTQDAYKANGVVFAVVLARLALFSEATLKFQNLKTKNIFGSPDLALLEAPWPNGTTGDLFARMEQDVSLWGNAFLWRAEDDRLVRLPPEQVTIVSEELHDPIGRPYKQVKGYAWQPDPLRRGPDDAIVLDVDEVAHWSPYPDPCAAWRGMSWLTPVLREIAADDAMTAYKSAYLRNAASPNLLIKYDIKLKPETVDALRERVHARYAGTENAFKTLVLDQGADATVIGSKLNEMSFADVQGAGENRICVASGVPAIIVGLKEGLSAATYSNYEQAMRRFADLTMRPLWRSACAALQRLITAPQGAKLWYDASDIAALRQSETEQAQTMQVKAAALQTFVQAGATLESAVAAISAGDINQLQAGPQQAPPSLPPPPPRVPGPESGNGKGPTAWQMTSMPPTLVGAPRANGRSLALAHRRAGHGGFTEALHPRDPDGKFSHGGVPAGLRPDETPGSGAHDPDSPEAIFGDLLDTDGSDWAQSCLDDLRLVPPDHMRQVAEAMRRGRRAGKPSGIYIGDKPLTDLDSLGDVKGEQPGGYPPGATWDDAEGMYRFGARVMVVGQPSDSGSTSTAVHEFGHALDDALKGPSGKVASQSAQFRQTYRRITGTKTSPQPYYTQSGDVGPKETFAEGYATWVMESKGDPQPQDRMLANIGGGLGVYDEGDAKVVGEALFGYYESL